MNEQQVSRGSTQYDVRAAFGEPAWNLTPELWVYCRFRAPDFPLADGHGCSTLLVAFTGKTVSDLTLANRRVIEIYAASPHARERLRVASGK